MLFSFSTFVRSSLLASAVIIAGTPAFAGDLLSTVKDKGVFTVATEARFPPFEYVEGGKIVGYSTDMMAEVMKALPGVKLKRLDLPFQGILPGLASSRFDYVVTSVVATPKRQEAYHLSVPIADATMAILKRKGDDKIMKPADMAGKAIGSQAGSAQLSILETFGKTLPTKPDVSTYTDFDQAYADLAAGRIEGVVNSLPNVLQAAKKRPDIFEVVTPTFGPKTYFAWAGRNDADSASLDKLIDEQILKMKKSGQLAKLQTKWFGAPMDLPDALPQPAAAK